MNNQIDSLISQISKSDLFKQIKSSDLVSTLLSNEQVKQLTEIISKNDKLIVYSLSTMSILYLLQKLINPSSAAHSRKNKKKKTKKNKKEEQKKVVVDPITFSNNEIDKIIMEFEGQYYQQMNDLFQKIDAKLDKLNGPGKETESKPSKKKSKSKKSKKSAKKEPVTPVVDKSSGSYKDKLNYQFLFYNEALLKFLMRLDSVDTHDDEKLRSKRKDSVRWIQSNCKVIDAYKPKMEELEGYGIDELDQLV